MFDEKIKKIVRTVGIVLIALIVILVGISAIMIYGQNRSDSDGLKQQKKLVRELPKIVQEYGDIQNQTANSLPCGIANFESPFVKPVQCSSDKISLGETYTITVDGTLSDESSGEKLADVEVVINNGKKVLTNNKGYFKTEVAVDNIKNVINVVADKFGYSPIRFIDNVKQINENGTAIEVAERVYLPIKMRKSETDKLVLYKNKDSIFESKKYPGVSLLIPAGGLQKSSGGVVLGEVDINVLYLTPENPEDIKFIPGFNGNIKQMIGVDAKGNQIALQSEGMVFFQITKKGDSEFLQLPKGVFATITQPMTKERYEILSDKDLQERGRLSEEDLEYYRKMGVMDSTISSQEKRDNLLQANAIAVNYWYFNKNTGLWEAWPVDDYQEDVKNKRYILKIPRFY